MKLVGDPEKFLYIVDTTRVLKAFLLES